MPATLPCFPWRVGKRLGQQLASVARAAGSGKSGLALNGPPGGGVEESPESVVADGEQEPIGIQFGEYAARCPVYGQLPGHQIGACVVSEGR
jgi:hypothetical protein